jgi:hypothetical protein
MHLLIKPIINIYIHILTKTYNIIINIYAYINMIYVLIIEFIYIYIIIHLLIKRRIYAYADRHIISGFIIAYI